jgi:sodium/potassium-transporting ATPase subunit alpha
MSDDRKLEILNTASSIYFVTLVVMQWFNLMAVRTRRLSIIHHPPLFRKATRNWYLFPAILFALAFALFFLYVPAFHDSLGTTIVPVEHWFIPFGLGMGILLIDEARKWAVQKFPRSFLAKIAW